MKNPKTTILGYLVLASAVLHVAIAALQGNFANLGVADVLSALSGVGLIAAADGSR